MEKTKNQFLHKKQHLLMVFFRLKYLSLVYDPRKKGMGFVNGKNVSEKKRFYEKISYREI